MGSEHISRLSRLTERTHADKYIWNVSLTTQQSFAHVLARERGGELGMMFWGTRRTHIAGFIVCWRLCRVATWEPNQKPRKPGWFFNQNLELDPTKHSTELSPQNPAIRTSLATPTTCCHGFRSAGGGLGVLMKPDLIRSVRACNERKRKPFRCDFDMMWWVGKSAHGSHGSSEDGDIDHVWTFSWKYVRMLSPIAYATDYIDTHLYAIIVSIKHSICIFIWSYNLNPYTPTTIQSFSHHTTFWFIAIVQSPNEMKFYPE